MKWNPRSRYEAIEKLAKQSEKVANDKLKYMKKGLGVSIKKDGEKIYCTIDITKPILPQIEFIQIESEWEQYKAKEKLLRASSGLTNEEFNNLLPIVEMIAEGKSFQFIGDNLWPNNPEPPARKSQAVRDYNKILSAHRYPRPARVRFPKGMKLEADDD